MDEQSHEKAYESVRPTAESMGIDMPKWADLSEEKKENIRQVNMQYSQYMNELGNAIHNGTKLPNPFK